MSRFPVYVLNGGIEKQIVNLFQTGNLPFYDEEYTPFVMKNKITLRYDDVAHVGYFYCDSYAILFSQSLGNCNAIEARFGPFINKTNTGFITFILKNLASLLGNNMIIGSHKTRIADLFLEKGWIEFYKNDSNRGYDSDIKYIFYPLKKEEMATRGFNFLSNRNVLTKAPVAEQADATDLKSVVETRTGSNPVGGTNQKENTNG